MEWDLRRTQSLRSIPSSGDKPTWTDAGLRDKNKSVSQLVARYQTTVEKTTGSPLTPRETSEGKTTKLLNEMTSPPVKTTETHLESLMKRNDERERSRVTTSLTRSKSVGSLQSGTGSIEALKALFESNDSAKRVKRPASETRSYTADTPVAEDVQRAPREQKPPAETKARKEAKEDHVTQKVVNQTQVDSRKTIAGIDFVKMAASEADEKRRSIADFRDSSFNQTKEILSVSVRAMSALYMSKVSTSSPTRTEQDQSRDSGKKVKPTKFQATCRETCSACLKPVYQMEKITADKYIFHKMCFCCKKCKKTLSMYSFAPLNGEFYCIFHYQQLFKRKGNYDEGFGRTQHKNRWLQNKTSVGDEESEA